MNPQLIDNAKRYASQIAENSSGLVEIAFLTHTLSMFRESALSEAGEESRQRRGITKDVFQDWYVEKMEAIRTGTIGFTCVQKDILGRKT